MASSSTESDSEFRSAEEDHVEDQSPDESKDQPEVKKAVRKKKRYRGKGILVRNLAAAKKGEGNIGGDGDDEKDDSEVDGKGKANGRKKANKAINISLRGSASKVHKLFQEMSAESREKFSSCCFGHLIGMPPFTVNRTLMCAVLRRYVKWDVFEFNGFDARCSLRDIALITGLSVTPIVNPIRYDEGRSPGRLRNRYLGTGAVTEYGLLKAIRSLESSQECDRDDLCKMHMLYFVSVFLLPNSAKNVDPKWIQMVEDLSKFNAHPWGFEVHRLLVDSFSHMFPRLGTPHFNAYGCLHVFTVWCYMHFPSLAPPIVDRVYPRLLAYKLKSRLKDKGGVGNTTLKTYETKVDKCLKKKNFIVQVEASLEERQAYDHHLPKVEDDPVRGSDILWVPKCSAAVTPSGSNGKDDQLVSGLTTGNFIQMMDTIMEGRVDEPIRELTRHVVPCTNPRGVSVDIGHSTGKRKTTASTSEMVLRRSPRKHPSSFPSTQSRRADDCQQGGAGTTRASRSAGSCGHPNKTQGDINKRVPVRQNKKMDPIEELVEEKEEIGDEDPKDQKPKECEPENGKEKEELAHLEKPHVPSQESVNAKEQAVEKLKESLPKRVDTGTTETHESDRSPASESRRPDLRQEAAGRTTPASCSAVYRRQPKTTQLDINKIVPDSKKRKADFVDERTEEQEIGDEDPKAGKPKDSGPENGNEKVELAHPESPQGAGQESVHEAEQGVEKPTGSLLNLVDTGSSVTHEVPVSKKNGMDQVEEQRKEKGDKERAERPKEFGPANEKEIGEEEQGGEKKTDPPQGMVVTGTTKTPKNQRSAKARGNRKLRVVERKRHDKEMKKGLAWAERSARVIELWNNWRIRVVYKDSEGHARKVGCADKGKVVQMIPDLLEAINNECSNSQQPNVNSIGSSRAPPAEILDEVLRYLDDMGVDGNLYVQDGMLDSRVTDTRCNPLHQRKMTLTRVLGVSKYLAEVNVDDSNPFIYLDRNGNYCMENDPKFALKISPAIVGSLKPQTRVNEWVVKWYACRLNRLVVSHHASPPIIVVDYELTMTLDKDVETHRRNLSFSKPYTTATRDLQFQMGQYGEGWARQLDKWNGVGKLVIPHRDKGEHWVLFVVDPVVREFIIHDPRGSRKKKSSDLTIARYNKTFEVIHTLLDLFSSAKFPKDQSQTDSPWALRVDDTVPKQACPYDSGVFILLYMDLLCRGVSLKVHGLSFTSRNMRYVLASELLADGGHFQ